MLRSTLLIIVLYLFSVHTAAAKTVRALFIGNSYVYTNDLPLIIKEIASSGGDTFIYNGNTPGGYTFQNHCADAQTLNLLAQSGWDYVILQEQSQRPSFPDGQVAAEVYPYAKKLDSIAHRYNPCVKTVFYMTWGRKNGDPQNCAGWPPVCTYTGMDSLLQLRYNIMAADNHAWVSPVARVWRMLRNQSASIELYNPDESHPSAAGSFAAACSFYSLLFGKNPAAVTYNYTLTASVAGTIKNAAKTIVSDSLSYWRRHKPVPIPAFTKTIASKTITLSNQSQFATGYKWTFGDNSTSTQASPSHTYAQNGVYTVCLTAFDACDTVSLCQQINIGNVGVGAVGGREEIKGYPNPANDRFFVNGLTEAVSYKIVDIAGRRCQNGTLTPSFNHFSTQSLNTGIYFLHISDKNQLLTQLKIIVAR